MMASLLRYSGDAVAWAEVPGVVPTYLLPFNRLRLGVSTAAYQRLLYFWLLVLFYRRVVVPRPYHRWLGERIPVPARF